CSAVYRLWTFVFFFFQAEDGIRDFHVTGVQTCALPIFGRNYHVDGFDLFAYPAKSEGKNSNDGRNNTSRQSIAGRWYQRENSCRSEERRVGKVGGWWWSGVNEKRREALW